ncbi:MAG: hypothetical protein IPP58_07455 [Holophagaceae bacterium]|uniref:Uncharacterized protein n=1 Tax=Candidatus Geothrix skivensis TaxID=2954439 RepID=A0A9D7SGN5_9BACT|nr:hypothetical protein [Candidatus Geothrix skivensis]
MPDETAAVLALLPAASARLAQKAAKPPWWHPYAPDLGSGAWRSRQTWAAGPATAA